MMGPVSVDTAHIVAGMCVVCKATHPVHVRLVRPILLLEMTREACNFSASLAINPLCSSLHP